ncbi:asparagine synthase-related protein [Saccharothrix obliqua]|uniref:asparagine synthase-related protein n=1 Tax=Saccharothrix obliqua TaxID=2861747 RepID=UPI001C5DEBA9|nr:asparagine synthase-related protein [Saccharothrix obliqua]MBW4719985.1 asparagine synthase [Saccharothrix obliqua]
MYELTNSVVVLPDTPGGTRASLRVPHRGPQVVAHASGRPWLIGHWAAGEVVVGGAGDVRIAVHGFSPVDAGRLAAVAARVRAPADLDRLARTLPGSAHLIASIGGRVRFQGSVSGFRPVFTALLDGVAVASDRADALAAMIGADPDEDLLAVHIACGQLMPPLAERSWWRGVERVPPDSYLQFTADRARVVRWWRPPEPALPLQVGAWRLREALEEAVAWRKPMLGAVSADLSGGMDSTSLCFLAAARTPDLITFRRDDGSAINDDPRYASRAAGLLVRARHLELGGAPPVFAPPYELPDTESPHTMTRGITTTRYQVRWLVERGATLHLAGHGADEVFTGSASYLHTLIRRKPLTALRHLRVHRALGRWPLLPTVAGLWSDRTLAEWWRACADGLGCPTPRDIPDLAWGSPLPTTPWATPDVVSTARRVLRDTAAEVWPLAGDRGQHETVISVRYAGVVLRQLVRDFAAGGLRLDLPYLDDRVVEAALAVRVHERFDPWLFKPLLAAAMRGRVPDFILNRRTKGDYEETVIRDQRRHVPDLLDLFADSALAARGLIDVDALRAGLHAQPSPESDDPSASLEMTLGCEMWLRQTGSVRRDDPGRTGPPADAGVPVA